MTVWQKVRFTSPIGLLTATAGPAGLTALSLPIPVSGTASEPVMVTPESGAPKVAVSGPNMPKITASVRGAPEVTVLGPGAPEVTALGPSAPEVTALGPSAPEVTALGPAEPRAVAAGSADAILELLGTQLEEYFAGTRREFSVPLDWSPVTGFRLDVLRRLHDSVPYGQTTSYGRLAAACGRPGAARLVGTIMGSNPFPIVVPCHRVLAGDGGIGGYGGGYRGVPVKRRLLELEGALPAALFD